MQNCAHTVLYIFRHLYLQTKNTSLAFDILFEGRKRQQKVSQMHFFNLDNGTVDPNAFKFTPHLITEGYLGYDISLINIKIPYSHDLYILI